MGNPLLVKQGVGGRDDGDVERIFADVNAEEVRVPKKKEKGEGETPVPG